MFRPKVKRRAIGLSLFIICVCAAATAQAATKRILIVGDSWAMSLTSKNHDGFPSPDVFDKTLAENGLGDVETQGAVTAWGGRKASFWAKPENLALIVAELNAYPAIDIVHLIIGGNDFLTAARDNDLKVKTAEERAVIWEGIAKDIQAIVDGCLAVRENIRVVIADYDYLDPRAAETYWKMDFHGASVAEFNGWLVELGRKKLDIAKKTPRCKYVQNWGTLQYWFGSPAKAVAYPGKAPDYIPYPGGDMGSPMPAGISPDGIHPNEQAHAKMLQNAIDQYYGAWLKPVADSQQTEAK